MNEANTQEKSMTIGSQFLQRITEAAPADDRDGVKDGFNIPLDSQARAMAAKLKLPFAKRLVAFHVMCGIPGRYMNTAEATEAIAGAADMLRKKVAVRRAFITLYEGLAAAKGFNIPQEEDGQVQEAKSDAKRLAAQNPEKIMKAKDVLKKAKKALADHNKTYDGGTGQRAKDLQAQIDKAQANLKKLTEGFEIDEAKAKRGSFIQKMLESVLVAFGVPENLVSTTGPSAVGTGIYQTAEMIEQDSTLERALRLLAARLDIRASDANEPVEESRAPRGAPALSSRPKKDTGWFIISKSGKAVDGPFRSAEEGEKERKYRDDNKQSMPGESVQYGKTEHMHFTKMDQVSEAVDVGNDEFAQAVVALCSALGIPDDVIERRRQPVIQSLRQKKASIRNRGQIMTMMGRLQDLIQRNTVDRAASAGGDDNAANTNESASRWKHLSALQQLDENARVKAYKLDIPGRRNDAFSKLSAEEQHEVLWDIFVETQDAVTIEDIKIKGDTLYVYPHWDDEYSQRTYEKLDRALSYALEDYNREHKSIDEAQA